MVKSGNKGFTLVEMVIAIALLAVLAVGILRLFVASQVTHQKAVDLDHAVIEANRLIEELQSGQGTSEYDIRFTKYYDKDWNPSALEDNTAHYAIYGDIISLTENQEGLLHIDLRVVRLKPYPLEKDKKSDIYTISTIIEDLTYWGENP